MQKPSKRSIRTFLILVGSAFILFILFVLGVSTWLYLRDVWSRTSFVLRNDLADPAITQLHITKSFFATKILQGPRSYYAYPIILEPGQAQSVLSGGKNICIALNSFERRGGNLAVPSGTPAWFQLDLPSSNKELRLSQLAAYAGKPCSHSFSGTEERNDRAAQNWLTKRRQEQSTSTVLTGENGK